MSEWVWEEGGEEGRPRFLVRPTSIPSCTACTLLVCSPSFFFQRRRGGRGVLYCVHALVVQHPRAHNASSSVSFFPFPFSPCLDRGGKKTDGGHFAWRERGRGPGREKAVAPKTTRQHKHGENSDGSSRHSLRGGGGIPLCAVKSDTAAHYYNWREGALHARYIHIVTVRYIVLFVGSTVGGEPLVFAIGNFE